TGIALFSALVYIIVMALTEAIERVIDPAGAES
ncbi:MAG TPA: ABC transporter permease, partial [Micrococcaceae bacterium]|nr:ABC transporter permease [Micrococcaceae bacterium]